MARQDTQPAVDSVIATIQAGQSLSGTVDLYGMSLQGIMMPAAWTAASITFAVSVDGVTFNPMTDPAGTEKTITVSASKYIALSTYDYRGVRYLQVRSGTSGAPVAQVAQAQITLVLRQGA